MRLLLWLGSGCAGLAVPGDDSGCTLKSRLASKALSRLRRTSSTRAVMELVFAVIICPLKQNIFT